MIRRHQASSGVSSRTPSGRDVIRRHQASSGVIRRHQASQVVPPQGETSSDVIRRHQASSGVIRRLKPYPLRARRDKHAVATRHDLLVYEFLDLVTCGEPRALC